MTNRLLSRHLLKLEDVDHRRLLLNQLQDHLISDDHRLRKIHILVLLVENKRVMSIVEY